MKKVLSILILFFTIIVYAATTRVTEQNKTYFVDSVSGYKIGMQPPSLSSSWVFTLPISAGTANQYLKTDGSGNTSWGTLVENAANNSLSNLTSTSINQSLNPSTNNSFDLGADSNLWSNIKARVFNFFELPINGTNKISLKAPDSLSADYSLTLPATDGTAGQVLSTDGAGQLSWSTGGGGGGGGANTYLSNLTSPVAINKDLQFDTDNLYSIGNNNLSPMAIKTYNSGLRVFNPVAQLYQIAWGMHPYFLPSVGTFLNTTTYKVGETFTNSASNYNLAGVVFAVGITSVTSGNIFLEVYNTSAGLPIGSPIATSESLNVSTFGYSGEPYYRFFKFNSQPTIVTNSTYAAVINISNATLSSGTIFVGSAGNSYGGGTPVKYDGATWTAVPSYDFDVIYFSGDIYTTNFSGPVVKNVINNDYVISPSGQTSNLNFIWPNTYGTNGQALLTDGAGVLSWGVMPIPNMQLQSFNTSGPIELSSYTTKDFILANATGGTLRLNLPQASLWNGKIFNIKNISTGSFPVVISNTFSQTIDGASSIIMSTQYQSVSITSSGTNWYIF